MAPAPAPGNVVKSPTERERQLLFGAYNRANERFKRILRADDPNSIDELVAAQALADSAHRNIQAYVDRHAEGGSRARKSDASLNRWLGESAVRRRMEEVCAARTRWSGKPTKVTNEKSMVTAETGDVANMDDHVYEGDWKESPPRKWGLIRGPYRPGTVAPIREIRRSERRDAIRQRQIKDKAIRDFVRAWDASGTTEGKKTDSRQQSNTTPLDRLLLDTDDEAYQLGECDMLEDFRVRVQRGCADTERGMVDAAKLHDDVTKWLAAERGSPPLACTDIDPETGVAVR